MGSSNERSSRRLFVAALAVLAACGGTTGLENLWIPPDAASGPDAWVATMVGSGIPVDATSGADGQADAGGDELIDADPWDRTVPTRPPPKDTGALAFDSAHAGDAGRPDADAAPTVSGPPDGSTTYSLLAAWSPQDAAAPCIKILDGAFDLRTIDLDVNPPVPPGQSCAVVNGCLDPTILGAGATCEMFDAAIPGSKELGDPRQNCLQTLYDILSSGCAASGQVTPCLCGDADTTLCLGSTGNATPNGPVYADYVKSYGVTKGADINALFSIPGFGASAANIVAGCAGPSGFNCDCLAGQR
jgi:hypothetical protein